MSTSSAAEQTGEPATGEASELQIHGRAIRVDLVYPPIPDRRFDWCAHWADYDEGDPLGYGPTAQAAIDDLRNVIDDAA
jgi:hypothetical protein